MNERYEDDAVRKSAEDRIAAEAARNEAEHFRRLAEDAREVRQVVEDMRRALREIRDVNKLDSN